MARPPIRLLVREAIGGQRERHEGMGLSDDQPLRDRQGRHIVLTDLAEYLLSFTELSQNPTAALAAALTAAHPCLLTSSVSPCIRESNARVTPLHPRLDGTEARRPW